MKKIFLYSLIAFAGALTTGCDLDISPADSMTGDQMSVSPNGLESLVNGCYSIMKDDQAGQSDNCWYLRQYYQMSDFSSDDVTYGWGTEDNLNMIFKYDERDPGLENFTSFWINNYKIIYEANVAIGIADKKEATKEVNYLKAEALFLKAFAMHNLVRFYAKPYSEANKSTPGIILRESDTDSQNKARASVDSTYKSIVRLLLQSEKLFGEAESSRSGSKGFVSVNATRALLCRVYLYMQDYQSCIDYASKVIESGAYTLETAEQFPTYFRNAFTEPETIWCLRMIQTDNQQSAAIASMIMTAGDGCWGEEGYSPSLLSDMGYNSASLRKADSRSTYVEPSSVNSSNLTLYPCSKFSWQDDMKTLCSPVMFRLAEMYLNRAEAYAHLSSSNTEKVLNDVNEVRKNRLVPDEKGNDFLYTSSSLSGTTLVDFVLKERRVEFCFEGFRYFDLLRNGKDFVRNYWGYHLNSFVPGQSTSSLPGTSVAGVTTKADYDRLIFPVPTQEIINNGECKQNQGY